MDETLWLKAEKERAGAEVEHWRRVHSEHPEWANPKTHLQDSEEYLAYLCAR